MRKLFAGPWIGEFGWELFAWQAYVRQVAEEYDYVTICSRPDKKFLYEDFADEFIPFTPSSNDVSMWACYNFNENEFEKIIPSPGVKWIEPRQMLSEFFEKHKNDLNLTTLEKFTPPNQKFIPYGTLRDNKEFNIIIHARNRTDAKAWPEKNWPIKNWKELVKYFSNFNLKIACVGHPRDAAFVEGAIDLRGVPLDDVADILASSKLCVGCSDGLLNFAALCLTPRIVWTSKAEADKNIDRHTKCWNPFNIPVKMITHKTWQPEVSTIIKAIEEYFG